MDPATRRRRRMARHNVSTDLFPEDAQAAKRKRECMFVGIFAATAAKVTIRRGKDERAIEILDFRSPTFIERLSAQAGVISPEIKDWRDMADCVLIDTNHDGEFFNIHLADIPAKKSDLVTGSYRLPAPPQGTTIAVKIIDMLGEEVVVREVV